MTVTEQAARNETRALLWTVAIAIGTVLLFVVAMHVADLIRPHYYCSAGAAYVVQEGETMSSIAEKFDAGDWQNVQLVNQGIPVDLHPGQIITRPACAKVGF